MPNPILLIEDNPADALLTTIALRNTHLANPILHFPDGVKALNYLFGKEEHTNRDLSELPVLILLDLRMPMLDGIEVLQAIKADERTKSIPVIVFSHSNEDPEVKKCYALGVNNYIVKPLNLANFGEEITKLGLHWIVQNQLSK